MFLIEKIDTMRLDLIFASGVLALDDKPVFDGRFVF
ncbi:hypothetical protein HK44_009730 [Pseudomonas fluorescens HK44]|uniref:Uncharacterized protein n=1 Tax=Pseudomonas fluorescens HK44 TaxID=1042209 RepID=A0A010RNT2_PSEFL|nr:hypothetical protein HK44_009730 [Pseudomonas fluorescens HK44]